MTLSRAHALMQQALEEEMFTGGVLLVKLGAQTLCHEPYGTVGGPGTPPVVQDTLFDLASLTKVVATTPCWMKLVEGDPGLLDAPLQRLFPEVPEDKRPITPRQLLAHASGLPHWRPYYLMRWPEPRSDAVLHQILRETLVYSPGAGCLYSDLGFMLLGFAMPLLSGLSLDGMAQEKVFVPLGLERDLVFRPSGLDGVIALTRPGEKAGLAHDLNCRSLGGVSGHAGLFGTARGVARVGEEVLGSLAADNSLFERSVARTFCSRAGFTPESSRALGFDTPTQEGASCGKAFSPESLGHTGFTGASLWMDPLTGVLVVLLTNRVFMGEGDLRIKDFRPLIHDCIMNEFSSRRVIRHD
jgi:serine-type D-Ala-D-Ala carboxypeptidase